jgi:hypothetical protein
MLFSFVIRYNPHKPITLTHEHYKAYKPPPRTTTNTHPNLITTLTLYQYNQTLKTFTDITIKPTLYRHLNKKLQPYANITIKPSTPITISQ